MSRWGNFLQGIESGLDKILAEDENNGNNSSSQNKLVKAATSNGIVRQDSSKRKPDRLRERLARAVDASTSDTKRTGQDSSENVERNSSEQSSIDNSRDCKTSVESEGTLNADTRIVTLETAQHDASTHSNSQPEDRNSGQDGLNRNETSPITTIHDKSGDNAATEQEEKRDMGELSESYLLERIDALQAKLDVFIQEAAERTRVAANTSSDAQSRKLAQQEERLASLMAEGQTLSRRELRHLAIIRRLHARNGELEAVISQERKANAEYQRSIQGLKLKIDNLEADNNSLSENDELTKNLRVGLAQTQRMRDSQASEIVQLRQELDHAKSSDLRGKLEEMRYSLDAERSLVSDLREELKTVRIEQELHTGKQRNQIEEEKAKSERERERSSMRESELQTEIRVLESRLESMRSRNEEVTGGPADDQAKQLRQIEALQRQYSVSKDNWNGIEASLNSRISSLELERDEISRKEVEIRKKLKGALTSSRKHEARLDELMISRSQTEEVLGNAQSDLTESRATIAKARDEIEQLKGELRKAQQQMTERTEKADVSNSGDKSASSVPASPYERASSPFATRKAPPGLEIRDRRSNHVLNPQPAFNIPQERPASSRKVSLVSPYFPSHLSGRQQSLPSATRSSSRSAARDTHSISVEDEAEVLDELATPATPGRGFGTVLSASVSTPAAGPSVQLVERMTSAVRRLESEKAATRDELDRLSAERDETRKQMASLLEEIEDKRLLEKRVNELESQVAETTQKYQTTLELLGEKSETVEELKADIADMKQIYREALEGSLG